MQIEEYERSAEDDEHFGIDYLKAMDAAEAAKMGPPLKTVPEEAAKTGTPLETVPEEAAENRH